MSNPIKIETEVTAVKTRTTELDDRQIAAILRAYLAVHWDVPAHEITGDIEASDYYGARARFSHKANIVLGEP